MSGYQNSSCSNGTTMSFFQLVVAVFRNPVGHKSMNFKKQKWYQGLIHTSKNCLDPQFYIIGLLHITFDCKLLFSPKMHSMFHVDVLVNCDAKF